MKRGEDESLEMALKLEEEAKLELQKQASQENKPNCKICFVDVEFDDIPFLECGHMFHSECLG